MEAIAHNPPALKQPRERAQKRGFSLIEAAFVLAVVGAVIGTIWVSAAAMYEDYKVNKTVEDLELIVKNVQGLISLSDAQSIGNVEITPQLRDASVFPKDWPNQSCCWVNTLLGYTVRVYNFSDQERFDVWFYRVPDSICVKLVTKISSVSAAMGSGYNSPSSLGYVQVNKHPDNSPLFSTQIFPISPSTAATACSQPYLHVGFTFGYTRINN